MYVCTHVQRVLHIKEYIYIAVVVVRSILLLVEAMPVGSAL